jgi:hypothetical protein
MKTLTRMVQGVISSLLLSAGLSQAASRLDPLAQSLNDQTDRGTRESGPAIGCTLPCLYSPRPTC